MRLNTRAVVSEVSRRMGCVKKDTLELLEHFSDLAAEVLARGGVVDFRPLGLLRLDQRGRVRFRASARFARRVRQAGTGSEAPSGGAAGPAPKREVSNACSTPC